MEQKFAVVTAGHAYLRETAENEAGINTSSVADEIFSGWAVQILEEQKEKMYVKVETHYGYTGYVKRKELRRISKKELQQRQAKNKFFRIRISEADLLDQPKVQGLPLELLLKNSIVELLESECLEGWSKVQTASGKSGYIHTQNLKKRMDSDNYLLLEEPAQKRHYFQNWKNPFWQSEHAEEELRESIAGSAEGFLGSQYRWGGKSSQGIDCSGLAFMSYLDQGILLYRDAQIAEGYPIKEIAREQLKTGDLVFFPGHVAIYLEGGKFIHATGYTVTPYVTINSLNPEDTDYREDLAASITGYGSIFG